jgi:hypothetical protein
MLANARGTSPTHPLAVVVAGGTCGLVSWACVSDIENDKRSTGIDLIADIPHRHREEHLPAQLPCRRRRQGHPTQDPIPEPPHVPRTRRVHVAFLRRQRHFLHRIRVHKEAHQPHGRGRRAPSRERFVVWARNDNKILLFLVGRNTIIKRVSAFGMCFGVSDPRC